MVSIKSKLLQVSLWWHWVITSLVVIIWVLIEVPDPQIPFANVQYDLQRCAAKHSYIFLLFHFSMEGLDCMETYEILNDIKFIDCQEFCFKDFTALLLLELFQCIANRNVLECVHPLVSLVVHYCVQNCTGFWRWTLAVELLQMILHMLPGPW
jgi:hypothetical protein